jgi:hypothetical protein
VCFVGEQQNNINVWQPKKGTPLILIFFRITGIGKTKVPKSSFQNKKASVVLALTCNAHLMMQLLFFLPLVRWYVYVCVHICNLKSLFGNPPRVGERPVLLGLLLMRCWRVERIKHGRVDGKRGRQRHRHVRSGIARMSRRQSQSL